jgi:hypothetical protein
MERTSWALIGFAMMTAASAVAELPPNISGTRPDPAGEPTVITISPLLLDVSRVDDADQSFTADFFLLMRWRDPRLAGAFASTQRVPVDRVWNPRIQILNQRDLDTTFPEQAEVATDGTVEIRQRYYGSFSAPMELHDFPLDQQRFIIQLVVPAYSPDEVELGLIPGADLDVLRSRGFSTADWSFGPITSGELPFEVLPGGSSVSGYHIRFDGRRNLGYWVGKAFVSVAIIIAMSWIVFWLDPKYVPARMSVTITSMLTLIAYRFLLGGDLPQLSYLTRMDHFLIASTLLVLLAVIQVAFTTALIDRDRGARADRINRLSRWSFPLAFLAMTIAVFSKL